MSKPQIHQYDVGIQFKVSLVDSTTGLARDASGAQSIQIVFQKPSRSYMTKTGHFLTDGSDGIVFYTSTSNDLDEIGFYRIQVFLFYNDGAIRSEIGSFRVLRNIPE